MAFIVVYDDQDCLCCPMGWNPECEGAIEVDGGPVAMFDDRKAAQKAVAISVRFAELLKAQGKPANDDFLSGKKHIKIRPLAAR
jgi:hypothetical protein